MINNELHFKNNHWYFNNVKYLFSEGIAHRKEQGYLLFLNSTTIFTKKDLNLFFCCIFIVMKFTF